MNGTDSLKAASDEALVERTRTGDQRAFAELWRRHYRSGARVARQFTSSVDADDLVSEAFTRIYQRVLAGGGPTGAFRPYLYTTIRNLASTWGAALSRDVQVDDITDFQDPASAGDPAAVALDKTLTARAFRSLPDRWQSVLWYTEVEGLDPHEVAPILGMTANGVAALSYRAREGLRKAWLQAHINDASASGECRWTISRIGDNARHALGARDSERIATHLASCAKCSIISEEVDEVGSRLAMVLIPVILGGVAGGAFLASLTAGTSTAVAASIPALPTAITAAAGSGATVGAAAAAAPALLVGTLAVAVAIGGAVAVVAPQATAPSVITASASSDPSDGTPTAAEEDDHRTALSSVRTAADDPANIPSALAPVDSVLGGVGGVVGGVVDGVVDPLLDTVTGPVVVDITLGGHGMPGATVTAAAAGVSASTQVHADGTFALTLAGVPQDAPVQLSQALGGPLGALGITIPLSLDSNVLGAVVSLLN